MSNAKVAHFLTLPFVLSYQIAWRGFRQSEKPYFGRSRHGSYLRA
jgi:hypothetical protein